jgi:hypothetical protein
MNSLGEINPELGECPVASNSAIIPQAVEPRYEISRDELFDRLTPCATELVTLLDADPPRYFYTSLETWQKIIPRILAGIPEYDPMFFNCNNIVPMARNRAAILYRLNTMGEAYFACCSHMMSCFYTERGLYFLEPQTGEIWRAEGFKATKILMC